MINVKKLKVNGSKNMRPRGHIFALLRVEIVQGTPYRYRNRSVSTIFIALTKEVETFFVCK